MLKVVARVGEFLASALVLFVLVLNQWIQRHLEQVLNASGVHSAMAFLYVTCAGILIFYWWRKMLPDRKVLLAFAFASVLFALREIYFAMQ